MQNHDNYQARDTLLVAGGLALMVMGAGMIMTHPAVRRTLLSGLGPVLPELQGVAREKISHVLPDIERYLKLRGM
jgi:hypothetical protein